MSYLPLQPNMQKAMDIGFTADASSISCTTSDNIQSVFFPEICQHEMKRSPNNSPGHYSKTSVVDADADETPCPKTKKRRTLDKVERHDLVKRACEPCRRHKLKCGNELPCSQCIARGTESCCVRRGTSGQMSLKTKPEYSDFSSTTLNNSNRSPSDDLLQHMPFMEMGLNREDICHWLQGLPADLCNQVMSGLREMRSKWNAQHISVDTPQEAANAGFASAINPLEHDLFNGHPTIGAFQVDFEINTSNSVRIFANQRFASMVGFPRFELLTRIAAKDLALVFPHIDLVYMVLSGFQTCDSLVEETALRVIPFGKSTVTYIQAQKQRVFDRKGRLMRVTHFWEVISHAVYTSLRDKGVLSNSSGWLGRRNPCCAEANTETNLTVSELAETCEGQESVDRLKQFANEVIAHMRECGSQVLDHGVCPAVPVPNLQPPRSLQPAPQAYCGNQCVQYPSHQQLPERRVRQQQPAQRHPHYNLQQNTMKMQQQQQQQPYPDHYFGNMPAPSSHQQPSAQYQQHNQVLQSVGHYQGIPKAGAWMQHPYTDMMEHEPAHSQPMNAGLNIPMQGKRDMGGQGFYPIVPTSGQMQGMGQEPKVNTHQGDNHNITFLDRDLILISGNQEDHLG